MIHEEYEEKSVFRQPDQYETVFLQLTIMCSESSEKKQLAQLLASVCNEVLSTIFPYNKGQITACYRDEDSFLGIVPFIRHSQTTENMYQDAFVIDLIENPKTTIIDKFTVDGRLFPGASVRNLAK